MQHQLRRQLADSLKTNVKAHSEFTSECCPIYSQHYEEWSQAMSRYRETSVFKRAVRGSLSSILKLKQQIFPDEEDDICPNEVQVKPVIKSLNYNFAMEVNENQTYMGNPFKKVRSPPKREDDELTVFERPEQKPPTTKPVTTKPTLAQEPPKK